MLDKLKVIYFSLPKERLKFLKYIPNGLLFGASYKKYRSKVSFSKEIITNNLVDILNYSRSYTSFGADHIPKNIYPDEVEFILNELPLVSSYDLSTNLHYYTSKEFNKRNAYLTTTGGTGRNPTSILLSNESYGIEWVHMHHIWLYAGYNKNKDLKLTLRGIGFKKNKLVEYNPIYNELIVNTFQIKEENFNLFIDKIRKYPIRFIHGYPSLVKEFMEYFNKFGYIPKIDGIFLGSEGATVEEKKKISKFFNAKVIHWYGQSEKVALAVDESSNGNFKVYTSYGFPRVVNGELVATTFINKALPLINYKIGDGADYFEEGNEIYLKNIQSRRGKDFVYLTKDKRISTTAINLHSLIQNEILYYQIHQKEFGKISIKVLPKKTSKVPIYTILKELEKEMKEKLKEFNINVIVVREDEIIRSKRGKMILLVQDLKL